MAHLWQTEGPTWVRLPLTAQRYALHAGAPAPAQPAVTLATDGSLATLSCYAREGQATIWVLFSSDAGTVRVNGHALLAGITVLHDRDEILIAGQSRFYFSTEETAKVEPFPASDGAVFCARCRQAISAGTPAVRCPSCGHWCEQSDDKPCWTYGPTCPMCEQPTAFDTGLRWTPEEE
jgi:hypothetical protein